MSGAPHEKGDKTMMGYLGKVEHVIIGAVILMMTLVVFFAALDVAWLIIKDLAEPPFFVIEVHQLLELFGIFLLVLIGVELLETLKKYYTEGRVDVHIIIAVALIALARKVITLEPKDYEPLTLIGLAALMLSLGIGYWLICKATKAGPDG